MLYNKLMTIALLVFSLAASTACEGIDGDYGSESTDKYDRAVDVCSKANETDDCEPYEAEDRSGANGCKKATNNAGFSGSGFMDFGGNGTWIEWNNIAAPIAGEYTLTFRYANGSAGNRQTAIIVGGKQVGSLSFAKTGGWKNWHTTTLKTSLKQGNNTVRVKANTSKGGPNLDNMLVVGKNLVQDDCPDDPNKTEPGLCGCSIPEGSCDTEKNIALGKPTRQSSTAYRGESARAVDGNTSGRYGDNSVTHTSPEFAPWWQVDLGAAYRVQSVTLFNRTDCCSNRLSDFHVDLLDRNDNVISSKDHAGQAEPKTVIDISASGVHSVRVRLSGTNPLSLAEVQVFGSQDTGGSSLCAEVNERQSATLSCPSGETISSIDFASYGLPTGSCETSFNKGSCHASGSESKVETACLAKQSCTVAASNGTFGDPCPGKYKKLSVVYTCSGDSDDQCPSDPNKTEPGDCGCGVADIDSDGDGTLDCEDDCPSDPEKVAPDNCGCGTPESECGALNVRFLQPSAGTVSANLGVVVDASALNRRIVEVKLYINNQFVRREGGAPYEWGTANTQNEDSLLLNLSQGTHELRAEAFDDDGAKGTATLSVTVSDTGEPGTYTDGPGKIIYPWRATTAVLKGGESFEVWFDAEPNQVVEAVKLRGPFNELNTSIDVEEGSWVYDKTSGNRYDTRISVSVPAGSPADRYDLILRTSIGDELSLGSVKVVKEYQTEYYVMHFSDTHTFQGGSDLSLYKVSTIAEIANILAPEMVFITGDNLYFPSDQRVDQFYNGIESKGVLGLHDFDAPTFVACGNHDWAQKGDSDAASKAKHYNQYYGLHGYNFTYGNGRFMVINAGWSGNSHQIADAVSWLDDVGLGDFRLGAAHMANGGVSGLYNGADLDLIVAGHNHYIADDNPHPISNEPIQYIASSIRDHAPEFNLFRVDVDSGTYTTVSGNTAQVVAIENPGDKDKPDLYRPRLTQSFSKSNDGTSLSNTAFIDNRFGFSLPEARVRFVMPLGYDYSVSEGIIVQIFDGFFSRIVDVRLTVDAGSTAVVNINRI